VSSSSHSHSSPRATFRISESPHRTFTVVSSSNDGRLCRTQYDHSGFVRLQHGARRLRHDGCQEAWRSSTTSEINNLRDTPSSYLLSLSPNAFELYLASTDAGVLTPSMFWSLHLSFGESSMPRLGLGSKANQRMQTPVSLFTVPLFMSFGHICSSFVADLVDLIIPFLIRAFCLGFGFPASTLPLPSFRLYFLSSHLTISDTLYLLTPPHLVPHSPTRLSKFQLLHVSKVSFFFC